MTLSYAYDAARDDLSDDAISVLSERAIAPLVASAQGIFDFTGDDAKTAALKLGLPDPTNGRTAGVKHIKSSTGDGAIGMPWYTPANIRGYFKKVSEGVTEISPQVSFGQWRPHHPSGGPKYLMAKGTKLSFGVHPATPEEWLNRPHSIIFAEGLFKCLATVSSHLRECGISDELLTQWLPSNEARAEMTRIMSSLDPERRVLVVGFVSVTTWEGREDWHDLADSVRGRTAYVGFDADVSANPNVWAQADHLWETLKRRHMTPALLTPSVPGMDVAGIDDYLHAGGTLRDLLTNASSDLPPSPGERILSGSLRVDDARACVEKAEITDGQTTWELVVPLGGRIISVDTRRTPNSDEMLSGKIERLRADSLESQDVEIEVTWRPRDGRDVQSATISGPVRMLSEDPRNWSRNKDILVPSEVQLLPQWPPPPQWLAAIKEHHEDRREDTNTWMRMGWVPTNSTPVFIAGRDVIGPHGSVDDVRPGVIDDDMLASALKFGLRLPESKEELRNDVVRLIDLYTNGVWQNPAIAGVTIAAALRPCVPLRPLTTIALAGPPNAGKSWTISRAMSFWQASPEAFTRQLPGSAEDSIASTEQSLSRAFIWVLDDAAAQATRQRSEQITENVNQAIRTTFNGTGRGRSTIDGQQRHRSNPQALLFVSAENFTGVESIQQRTILISVSRGEFLSISQDPTNAVTADEKTFGNNHIAATGVQLIAQSAAEFGWDQCLKMWNARVKLARDAATEAIREASTQSDRGADIAGDLVLGLDVLGDVAEYAEVPDKYLAKIEEMRDQVFEHVAVMWRDQNDMSGGRRLLRALAAMLAAGEVAISAPGKASAPFEDLDTTSPWRPMLSDIHQRLGWTPAASSIPAQMRQGAKSIGYAVMADGEPVILFDANTAFKYAAQSRPELVSPGQRATETWSQVWSEHLPSLHWARRSGNGNRGRPRVTVRVTVDHTPYEGVPIPLETLLEWSGLQKPE